MQIKFCFKANVAFPSSDVSLDKLSQIIYEAMRLRNKSAVTFTLIKNKKEISLVKKTESIDLKRNEELLLVLYAEQNADLLCFNMKIVHPESFFGTPDLAAIKLFFNEAFNFSRTSRDLSKKISQAVPNYEEVTKKLSRHQLFENRILKEILSSLVIYSSNLTN